MLVLFTCSQDITSDWLMPFLKDIEVFRFDIDKWRQYDWDFSSNGFAARSPDGKILTSENAACMYVRKPMFFEMLDIPAGGSFENWCRSEVENLWRDMYHRFHFENRLSLVHPPKFELYKHTQMTLAKKYFEVPQWHIVRGKFPQELEGGEWVAKTLTQVPMGGGKILFVKKVDTARLDPQFPWFLQRRVEADSDATVLYVNGEMFAFELNRADFEGDDYRKTQPFDPNMTWRQFELSPSERASIDAYMKDVGLDFGRFDFLRKDGRLIFLELNPNGQWGWLDLQNKLGILGFVANEIVKKHNACR